MVTIQFSLLGNPDDPLFFRANGSDYGYELYSVMEVMGGSITIPQASKDNLIEYLTEKYNVLAGGSFDDEYMDTYFELVSYPTSVPGLDIKETKTGNSSATPEYYTAHDVKIVGIRGTTMAIQIECRKKPYLRSGVCVHIAIDLSTSTVTETMISANNKMSNNLNSMWVSTRVYITDTASAGSSSSGSGWTGKDGYVDNDKSLESAFISNAKPGNAGSTATYKPDEDGYYNIS